MNELFPHYYPLSLNTFLLTTNMSKWYYSEFPQFCNDVSAGQSAFLNNHMLLNSLFLGLFADVKLSHLRWWHKCGGSDSADPSVPPSGPGSPQRSYRLVEKEEASAAGGKVDVSCCLLTIKDKQKEQAEENNGDDVGRGLGRVRFLFRSLLLERKKTHLKSSSALQQSVST